MSKKKWICPKCQGLLRVQTSRQNGGCEIHQVSCGRCGLKGDQEFTANFALACFYRENGDTLVSLAEIEQTGGPPAGTMEMRIIQGFYPEAQKKGRIWKLPRETADRVINEWKQCKEMIPLAEAAVLCGLKRTSLNLKASRDEVHGQRFYNRWYVTKAELARLQEYYCGTVTSTEAALILGLCHRTCVLKLARAGKVDSMHLGTERRFSRDALQQMIDSRVSK